jgi:hypothetical protein
MSQELIGVIMEKLGLEVEIESKLVGALELLKGALSAESTIDNC